jgi:hypothetical protein
MPDKAKSSLPSDPGGGSAFPSFHTAAPTAEDRPERVVRISSSLASIRAIVADRRPDYGSFLEEDHGEHGKAERDLIKALFKAIPE